MLLRCLSLSCLWTILSALLRSSLLFMKLLASLEERYVWLAMTLPPACAFFCAPLSRIVDLSRKCWCRGAVLLEVKEFCCWNCASTRAAHGCVPLEVSSTMSGRFGQCTRISSRAWCFSFRSSIVRGVSSLKMPLALVRHIMFSGSDVCRLRRCCPSFGSGFSVSSLP